jgi:hypothetical protein
LERTPLPLPQARPAPPQLPQTTQKPKRPFSVIEATEGFLNIRAVARTLSRSDEEPEQSDRTEEVKALKRGERGYSATCDGRPYRSRLSQQQKIGCSSSEGKKTGDLTYQFAEL